MQKGNLTNFIISDYKVGTILRLLVLVQKAHNLAQFMFKYNLS
jgi:hypothetical protein